MKIESPSPPDSSFQQSTSQSSFSSLTLTTNGQQNNSNFQNYSLMINQQTIQSLPHQYSIDDVSSNIPLFITTIPNARDTQSQANPPNADIILEEKYIEFENATEKLIKLNVPAPLEPKKNRFLEDWQIYGQIRFFDTANYNPEIPKNIVDYMETMVTSNRQCSLGGKDYDAIKELLCEHLYQDLMRYFIWRVPIRFLHTVCDRLINLHPIWDDGTPTKTVK